MTVPLVLAAAAFDIALVPTLLPRPWWVSGIFVGVAAAETFLASTVVRGLVRRVRRSTAARGEVTAAHRWTWAVVGILLLVSAVAGQLRQAMLERSMGLDPGSLLQQIEHQAGSITLGLATAGLLVGLVALAVKAAALGWRVVRRPFAGSPSLRAAVMVPLLVLGSGTMSTAGGPAAAATPAARPLVVSDAWAQPVGTSLGPKGRQFIDGTTPSSTIARATGEPARQPLRVYAELRPGEDDGTRAARAVAQLHRAGGLDRSAVVVAVPTGSGWVDPAAVSAVETLTGGDVATLAVQYANVPSWVAYLRGAGAAERTAYAAIRDVRALIDTVPERRRPRLLVYGESLGALGGLRALADGSNVVDDALWVGVPADVAELARQASRDGQTVLVHQDDPVAAWSATLAVRPAAGWRSAWWPVVTFWQATADLVSAYSTPDGYGHRYGVELVGAWGSVLSHVGLAAPGDDAAPGPTSLTGVRQLVAHTSDGGSSLPGRVPAA
jgi:uncharacterized membrane protein